MIVGKALAGGRREDVILATEVHGQMGVPVDAPMGTTGDPNRRGNSRRWIVREVEDSLRRLDTDWIDLYQIHRPDPDTDVEETLAALTDLQRQGKIRWNTWSRRSGRPTCASRRTSSTGSTRSCRPA